VTAFTELVLDAAREASVRTGVGIGIVVAANRTRHPLDARTLARVAAQYAGRGVVGFGLSNDERRGRTEDFAPAFRIAARAGLPAVPHGGELLGAAHVETVLDALGARRLGHGVRTVEDTRLLTRVVEAGVALEVCPASNVALGVYATPADVPLRVLHDAGARLALVGPTTRAVRLGASSIPHRSGVQTTRLSTYAELASCARIGAGVVPQPDSVKARLEGAGHQQLAGTPEPAPRSQP
jgi:adenosine deaminase